MTTLREAIVHRLEASTDNVDAGGFLLVAVAVPVIITVIVICVTVYYSLKLFS